MRKAKSKGTQKGTKKKNLGKTHFQDTLKTLLIFLILKGWSTHFPQHCIFRHTFSWYQTRRIKSAHSRSSIYIWLKDKFRWYIYIYIFIPKTSWDIFLTLSADAARIWMNVILTYNISSKKGSQCRLKKAPLYNDYKLIMSKSSSYHSIFTKIMFFSPLYFLHCNKILED